MQAAVEHTGVHARRMAALGQLAGGVAHDVNGHGLDRRAGPDRFSTTKTEGKGTGFGGFLEVDSAPGTGTTVRVFLPEAPPQDPATSGQEGAAAAGGTETILLAEDDHVVHGLVLRTLTRAGYQVLAAADGAEALALAAEHAGPIHLVLSDLVMPQMSGPQLLATLRRTRASIRALMMTAHTDHPTLDAQLELEPDAVLRKPFKPATLLTTVRRRLDEEGGTRDPGRVGR